MNCLVDRQCPFPDEPESIVRSQPAVRSRTFRSGALAACLQELRCINTDTAACGNEMAPHLLDPALSGRRPESGPGSQQFC